MSESSLTQLKIIVERVVRPVRASWTRKRKMREELLAHVSGVFEEESARLGDDRAALEQTALRFGSSATVTSQLQESVPASDGISRFFDVDGPPGDSMFRDAFRLVRLTVAAALVIDMVGIAQFAAGWWRTTPGEVLFAGVMFSVGSPLYALILGCLAYWIEKTLHQLHTEISPVNDRAIALGFLAELRGPTGRSRLWMALIADVFVLVLLCIAAVAIGPPENWNTPTAVLAAVVATVYLAADTVILAWAIANSAGVRRRYDEQWTRLPIEPSS